MTIEEVKKHRYWFKYEYKGDEDEYFLEDAHSFVIENGEYGENTICLYQNSEFIQARAELLESDLAKLDTLEEVAAWLFRELIEPFEEHALYKESYITDVSVERVKW